VTAEVRTAVQEWVKEEPTRGRARWYNDRRRPLEWDADGARYRPTEIVRRILADAAGIERSVRGPSWWMLEDGRDLPTVAGVPERATFDWTELHMLLAGLPTGGWTTYGDLASVIGTAPQPLGQHVTTCTSCANAYRVLGADGRPRAGFHWTDASDLRTQQQALERKVSASRPDKLIPTDDSALTISSASSSSQVTLVASHVNADLGEWLHVAERRSGASFWAATLWCVSSVVRLLALVSWLRGVAESADARDPGVLRRRAC
jgi:alkylated DNA nucleotide flippase Atl1